MSVGGLTLAVSPAQSAAGNALEQIGTKAVVHLVGLLADPDENGRLNSIVVLFRLRPGAKELQTKEMLAALAAALKDKQVHVRIHAAGALGQMTSDAELMLPNLLASKGESDNRIAAEGLRGMGPKAKAALPRLRELLDDDGYGVAEGARKAIAKIEAK